MCTSFDKRFKDLSGVIRWGEEPHAVDTLFECEVAGSDVTSPIPVSVTKDLTCVSIGAYHEDGLKAALEIQRRYGDEVFAFSEELSPDVVALSTVESPKALAEKLRLR